ncbi:hypothetical protein P8452_47535 [Trifolium repens]|nr:hypothetical protein P8452_47535 [Trifolium repens]
MSSASSKYIVSLHLTRSLPPSMSHLDGLNWEVLVVNKPDITTNCYVGGKIVSTTSSICHYPSDAQLAIVLPHEVAHIVAGHYGELETRSMSLFYT